MVLGISKRFKGGVRKVRNAPGTALERRVPQPFEKLPVGRGTLAGAIAQGIGVILQDTIGLPFGAEAEVVEVEQTENGYLYTVNVNAPSENLAQARAFLESTTGFTSYFTDRFDVKEANVINGRVLRDTFIVKIEVIP